MNVLVWIGLFVASSLFWAWLLFWGGAEWLDGSFLSGLLIHFRAPEWGAEGIKLFAVLSWLGQTIWFVIGLFAKSSRW